MAPARAGQWREGVEDGEAGAREAAHAGDLNRTGGENGDTGGCIAESDMREWIDGTVRVIEDLPPKR
ncbi:hypothetical protein, partial [Saccharothrix sp. ST-888]|uniref:hypothetical protein n=1 Tax=Saccharothrix sp. ST-888 TaxID=1427391 RepID=UPI0005ECAAF9